MGYDVIAAGASFAGLAAARQLRGKLLLVEPYPVGEHQTSACAKLSCREDRIAGEARRPR